MLYSLIISFSISVLFPQRTHASLIDLVESFPTINIIFSPFSSTLLSSLLVFECRKILDSNEYLVAKFDFDTAEKESSRVCQKIVRQLDRMIEDKHRQNQKRNVALQGFLQDAIDMLKEQEDVEGDTTMPHPLALHNSKWKSYYFSSALDATLGKCRQVITVAGNDVSIQGEDTEDGPFLRRI